MPTGAEIAEAVSWVQQYKKAESWDHRLRVGRRRLEPEASDVPCIS